MDREEIEKLVAELAADGTSNCSLIQFVRGNPVTGIERAGRSVLVRGRSDRDWVYASSRSPAELAALAARLGEGDDAFAAIEEWMVPVLRRGRELKWSLAMVRFTLPDGVALPAPDGGTEPLSPEDAATVFASSDYAEYISPEYARARILAGPSFGIREQGALVAWGMTQDDGAMGFLHVVERCRHRGCGRRIVTALAAELRRRRRRPFAYVAEENAPAIALVTGLGFERGERVRWFGLG